MRATPRSSCIATVSGFLLSLQLRYICRWLWRQSPTRDDRRRDAVAVTLLALCWRVVINLAYRTSSSPMEWVIQDDVRDLRRRDVVDLPAAVLGRASTSASSTTSQLQQQREATLRAATLAQEAQLKMLRYQLNPHFLFNTLNAISTLILDNENRTANQTVMRLSEFLRYTLDQDPMKKVTLRQEIEALNLYLTTEKLRFGDRLQARVRGRGTRAWRRWCRACCCSR